MKNKLIIKIVLVYFVLLAVVLAVQVKNRKGNTYTEPLRDNARYRDVLSSSVVLYDRSPVMLVKQKQTLVDDENSARVPVVGDKTAMLPLDFFSQAYGAVVSSDEDEQTVTVRLNNKALVADGKTDEVTLVSATDEKQLKAAAKVEFKSGTAYISANSFAEAFGKKLKICDGAVLLSDKEIKLNDEDMKKFAEVVGSQIHDLPTVGEQSKLEQLLGGGNVNIFNAIEESIGIKQDKSPVSTLGLDANGLDTPKNICSDDEYIYYVDNGKINIVSAEDTKSVGVVEPHFMEIYGIYVSGSYLSVIGNGRPRQNDDGYPYSCCLVSVYDITDKASPTLTREVCAEGVYTFACKKDGVLYFVTKKAVDGADSYDLPSYVDSSNYDVGSVKSLSDVHYVPEMADKAYTSVIGFNITDMGRALNIYTVLGCGDNLSITGNSLYITVPSADGTSMYKLSLTDGGFDYAAAGFINKLSIPDASCVNEYGDTLRIAAAGENTADIMLFDEKMDEKDSLKNIGIDGSMVSARFIGGRGYLVSDSTTKPVFAVNLTDEPKEIGSINIPQGTEAVRNFDADHFICIKENGTLSMLNIADTDGQYEAFTINAGGRCDKDKTWINTDDGILAVPVDVYKEESTETTTTEQTTLAEETVETSTQIISETTVENESETVSENAENTTAEGTESTTQQEITPNFDGEPDYQAVNIYKVDMQNNAFVQIAEISHNKDKYSKDSVIKDALYKNGSVYTRSDKKLERTDVK